MHNVTSQVREYFALAAAGTPSVPRCEDCGVRFLPPRAACPRCGATRLGWFDATGAQGTVYSLTRKDDGSVTALADLDCVDGGGRLLAAVVGAKAQEVRIGDPVVLDTAESDFELADRVPVLRRGEAR